MNIHEYQAKELYRDYDVPTAQGFPAFTVDEAVAAASKLPGPVWVVKSQIHAGGRGKGKFKEAEAGDAGGVRLAKSVDSGDRIGPLTRYFANNNVEVVVQILIERSLNGSLIEGSKYQAGRDDRDRCPNASAEYEPERK